MVSPVDNLLFFGISGLRGADAGNLRAGAQRGHQDPGRLGGRQEWICSQHGPFLRGGDEGEQAVFLLIQAGGGTYVDLSFLWLRLLSGQELLGPFIPFQFT